MSNLALIRNEINRWSRAELVAYLERWGYQVYDYESDEDLRDAAFQNAKTEGGL